MLADLTELADDAFAGRFGHGAQMATGWLSDSYGEMGVRPLGETYRSEFAGPGGFVTWQENHYVTLATGEKRRGLADDDVVSASFAEVGSGLGQAVLVRADPPSSGLQSKVALIAAGDWAVPELTQRLETIDAAGAIAALVVVDDGHPLPEAGTLPKHGLDVDLHAAFVRQSALAGLSVEGRPIDEALASSRTAQWRTRPVDGARASVLQTLQRAYRAEHNVLAVLPGSDLEDEVVVIGAHYDHIGRVGYGLSCRRWPVGDDTDDVCNGADDNASGTAAVLAIARAMVESGYEPRRTLVFAHFGAEEPGLYGSKVVARDLGARTVAMLNLDMVGRLENKPLGVFIGGDDGTLQGLVEHSRPSHLAVRPDETITDRSDQHSFLEQGVPVVALFTGLHEDYHRTSDEVDGIDAEGLTLVAQLALEVARELGNGHPVNTRG